MKELVEFIVKSLVDDKDAVEVLTQNDGKDINILVKVADSDLGKVIGRDGKVANSIRTVVKTSAKKQNIFVSLKFAAKK
jgi:hypothetical protein